MKTLHTTELQTAVGSRARTAVREIPTGAGPVREISVIADAVLTVAEARQLLADLQRAVAVADGDAVDVPTTPTNPPPRPRETTMPDTTPSVPADVVQAAQLIHGDISEAMDVIYGDVGGIDDTPEDVDATSKRIADDIRIVLNWVLEQAEVSR